MDENMTNEIVEVVEDYTPSTSGNGLKIVGGGLIAAGLIYGGYKLVNKIIKSKKRKAEASATETVECDYVDNSEE